MYAIKDAVTVTEILPCAKEYIVNQVLLNNKGAINLLDTDHYPYKESEEINFTTQFKKHLSSKTKLTSDEIKQLIPVAVFLHLKVKVLSHIRALTITDKQWFYNTAFDYLDLHFKDWVQVVIDTAENVHLNYNTDLEEYEVVSVH